MVVADIVLLVLAIAVAVLVIQRRRRADPETPSLADLHTAQLRDEMEQLRERIQTLERVITDTHGSDDLTREIERLRDR